MEKINIHAGLHTQQLYPGKAGCARAKTERIYFLEQSHDWFAYTV